MQFFTKLNNESPKLISAFCRSCFVKCKDTGHQPMLNDKKVRIINIIKRKVKQKKMIMPLHLQHSWHPPLDHLLYHPDARPWIGSEEQDLPGAHQYCLLPDSVLSHVRHVPSANRIE